VQRKHAGLWICTNHVVTKLDKTADLKPPKQTNKQTNKLSKSAKIIIIPNNIGNYHWVVAV
jgi:hypothetical protein